jgi:hypothetical protein
MPKSGNWTVPDRDEARRIVWHLKHPDWRIVPGYYSPDGKWDARHGGTVDLEASTLGGLMDELDDYALMAQPELPRRCFLQPPIVLVSPALYPSGYRASTERPEPTKPPAGDSSVGNGMPYPAGLDPRSPTPQLVGGHSCDRHVHDVLEQEHHERGGPDHVESPAITHHGGALCERRQCQPGSRTLAGR